MNEIATASSDPTHVILGGNKHLYIKKLTRAVGFLPRMDAKDEHGKIIPVEPLPWIHLSGIVTEAEMEAGEDRDLLRVFGLFTITARKADGTMEHFISRNMILTDLEDYFASKLDPMKRRARKGGPVTDYLGLPDFTELRFDLELWVKTPTVPNRRGYDVEIREIVPATRDFILNHGTPRHVPFGKKNVAPEKVPTETKPAGKQSDTPVDKKADKAA